MAAGPIGFIQEIFILGLDFRARSVHTSLQTKLAMHLHPTDMSFAKPVFANLVVVVRVVVVALALARFG
jgi:hypothetical protein